MMKRFIPVLLAAWIFGAPYASAQQYVSPVYGQSLSGGMQPYAGAQNPAPAPAPSAQIPSSSNYGSYAPPAYNSNAVPAATATGYAPAPSFTAADSYATFAAAQQPRRVYNWNGCYLGGYLGGAFAGNVNTSPLLSQGGAASFGSPYSATSFTGSYSPDTGFMGGGTLGCNIEVKENWDAVTGMVFGVEGEGGTLSINAKGTTPNGPDINDKTHIGDWDAILAGRAGVAFDRTFLYGKFGAVFSEADSATTDGCITGNCNSGTINAHGHQDIADAAIGGGIEYALDDGWSIKGEYMYLDTSDNYEVCGAGGGSAAGSAYCSQHELNGTHTVKLGLNYHFEDLFTPRAPTAPRW